MYWPKFLYEIRPLVYIFIGLNALFSADPKWGQFSGLLLVAASLVILYQRYDYRKTYK